MKHIKCKFIEADLLFGGFNKNDNLICVHLIEWVKRFICIYLILWFEFMIKTFNAHGPEWSYFSKLIQFYYAQTPTQPWGVLRYSQLIWSIFDEIQRKPSLSSLYFLS